MGLSASSLRIAMLTARKSSLEFEGQQINQQRLSLSNQTAALFNAMLTMQVPTPPDPTEFSKMVYTFNKGDGLSTLLNVSRNASGPYTHDVTYKGPKTDSVLMKKQLNNVGFKHENGQMSAVIDGMNYDLTLNGNEEKLNEYLKTKGTYDNLKNIEAQMSSLQKMSSTKELSSQQMKQYFETLGLTSLETPQSEKVLDVQNTDDAFQNVYNSGSGNYSYRDVTLTYAASTSPINVDDEVENQTVYTKQLTCQSGSLSCSHETGYTYTTRDLPNGNKSDTDLTYIISNKEGDWAWTLAGITNEQLNNFGITNEKTVYGFVDHNNFVEVFQNSSYVYGDTTYTNIKQNEDGTWEWEEVKPLESNEIEYCLGENILNLQENSITINNEVYTPTFESEQWIFTRSQIITSTPPMVEMTNPFNFDKDENIRYDIDSDGNDEIFIRNKEASYTCTTVPNFGYSIANNNGNYVLTCSSNNYFGRHNAYSRDKFDYFYTKDPTQTEQAYELDIPKGMQGYWYNTKGYVACEQGSLVIDANNENYTGNEDWVFVTYNDNTKKWQYQKQLTQVVGSTFEGNTYTSNDNGQTFQYNDEKYDNGTKVKGRTCILSKDDKGDWQIQYRYTAEQLGITIKEPSESQPVYKTGQSSPPSWIVAKNTFTYNNGTQDSSDDVIKYVSDNEAANFTIDGKQVTVKKNGDTINLSGQGLPSGVEETDGKETIQVSTPGHAQGTSNGVKYSVIDKGSKAQQRYSITAKFKAWVTGEDNTAWSNDEKQDGYSYDETNHTLTLTTPNGAIAQILLRNQNNQRDEDCDKNITVNEMLGFYEQILKQFGLYGSSATYKTKLDKAKSDYLSTIDAKGVENPGENQALFNFIDANGKNAYIYVPLDYINKDGQVDSTYAYMYETSYLENQTETISQKANIIYDENGRIVKISFDDGTVVLPEVKTEQDEEAYNAAMVKYDYEKQVYDKELSDINAKTEVIAQQDKNLEIKLKSIDTQHSAISTEIEALNKVLQNNVKSGFNTFNA